ncbi:hypothetical protein FG95_00585 [Sphingopyxis sp. LC363]|jgi:hypothetical protein|nr:hypothetical protein FG95_00585 [Sphingopyxis sp. LC363]
MAVWIALGAAFMGLAVVFFATYAARQGGKGKGE